MFGAFKGAKHPKDASINASLFEKQAKLEKRRGHGETGSRGVIVGLPLPFARLPLLISTLRQKAF